jgi:acetyl esterase/lipase
MSDPDVVVVGGGSAGAVLAARLSQDPARTVLLLPPGHSTLPPIPSSASSACRDSDSALTPAFVAEYGDSAGTPISPPMDDVLTMCPPPAARMSGRNSARR